MAYMILFIVNVLQVGLGTYILFQDTRSWANRLFAACMFIYSWGTLLGLLRLMAPPQEVAAVLVMLGAIVVYVWNATFVGLSVLAIFYPHWMRAYRTWSIYLPIAIALVETVAIVISFLLLPDRGAIVAHIPGTDIYHVSPSNFAVRQATVIGSAFWALLSFGLLINVAIRRRRDRVPALLLAGAILLTPLLGLLSIRVLEGSLKILVPTLSSGLLAVAFGYVIVRYRLFSAQEVTTDLILNLLHDGILVLRHDGVVVDCNPAAIRLLNLSREQILGRNVTEVVNRAAAREPVWEELFRALQKNQEAEAQRGEKTVAGEVTPIRDPQGMTHGYVCILRDLTDLRRNEREVERRNAELQQALRELENTTRDQGELLETIRMLSAPAVPVIQGIVVMPLSGQIDSDRARRIMDNLLSGIHDYDARVAIMDITGVPVVDSIVAGHLIQAARAASLMGCHPLLVGIRPEIAQVIVELGIDMEGLTTFSDLQSGVEYALRLLGLRLIEAPRPQGKHDAKAKPAVGN